MDEKKKLLNSLFLPFFFVVILWVVEIFEFLTGIQLSFLGVYPLHLEGLAGIVLSPLIHGDFQHLIANTVPVFVLGAGLIYFFPAKYYRILIGIWILTGLWVWLFARDSYHIGASGLIYGMASFLFFAGAIKRESRLLAFGLLIIFLYGGLVWGVFPDFYPDRNISWESHLMGAVSGLVMAVYYRKDGPQKKDYWADEEDEEDDDDNNFYSWDGKEVKYWYKEDQ